MSSQFLESIAEICRNLGLDSQVRKDYVNVLIKQKAVYLVLEGQNIRVEVGPTEYTIPLAQLPNLIQLLIAIVS